MKPEVILKESPKLMLSGFYLILLIVFVGGYIWKMNQMNLDIPYQYIIILILVVFLISKVSPKKTYKITEEGFEYRKGRKLIKDSWSNVKKIGIQGSGGKPVSFFIGATDYKTDLISFTALMVECKDKKSRGYRDEVIQILKDYSGIDPVFSDHFTYNKSNKVPIIIWALIILIIISYLIFTLRFI